MHVGMGVIFQNPGKERTDREVYEADMALAEAAEPLVSTVSGRSNITSPTTPCALTR